MTRTYLLATFIVFGIAAQAQKLPFDSASGMIVYKKTIAVKPKCKKKIKKKTLAWSTEKLDFPPMVFSVVKESGDTLWLRAVTEVPSAKKLHPISFDVRLISAKREITSRAEHFKFEDISLSLEDWLDKYKDSDSPRHQKNVELISKGLDSHVFLMLEDLKKEIGS